jgi:predicted NBD/HSP70 family sugar kinase
VSARRVVQAAKAGDERAAAVVADEAELIARAVCAIVTVIDPELVVLGGGIGQAPGFAEEVAVQLNRLSPVQPEVRVSALGTEAVVDGCLASGAGLAWQRLTAMLPSLSASDGAAAGGELR